MFKHEIRIYFGVFVYCSIFEMCVNSKSHNLWFPLVLEFVLYVSKFGSYWQGNFQLMFWFMSTFLLGEIKPGTEAKSAHIQHSRMKVN